MKSISRGLPSGGASVVLTFALAAALLLSFKNSEKPQSRASVNVAQSSPPDSITLPPPPASQPKSQLIAPPLKTLAPKPAPPSSSSAFVKKAPVVVKNDTSPVSPSALKTGRVLLRKLEAGQGPSIEIGWPSSRPERDALYRVFVRCYGMTTAILSEDDQLFRVKDPAGRPWRLNRDRYSGFLRQATGQAVYAERQTLAQIRARHGLVAGTPIRLFPRRVDAALLGGLHQITNARFGDGVSIRARYQRSGSTVRVLSLRIGGRAMPGEIVLPSDCGD